MELTEDIKNEIKQLITTITIPKLKYISKAVVNKLQPKIDSLENKQKELNDEIQQKTNLLTIKQKTISKLEDKYKYLIKENPKLQEVINEETYNIINDLHYKKLQKQIKLLTQQIANLNIDIISKKSEIKRFKNRSILEESSNLSISNLLQQKMSKLQIIQNQLQDKLIQLKKLKHNNYILEEQYLNKNTSMLQYKTLLNQKENNFNILQRKHSILEEEYLDIKNTNDHIISSLNKSNDILVDYLKHILYSLRDSINLYEEQDLNKNVNLLELTSLFKNLNYKLENNGKNGLGNFDDEPTQLSNWRNSGINEDVNVSDSIVSLKIYNSDDSGTLIDNNKNSIPYQKGNYVIYKNKLHKVLNETNNLNIVKILDDVKNKYDNSIKETKNTFEDLLKKEYGNSDNIQKLIDKFEKKNKNILKKYKDSLQKINTILIKLYKKYNTLREKVSSPKTVL